MRIRHNRQGGIPLAGIIHTRIPILSLIGILVLGLAGSCIPWAAPPTASVSPGSAASPSPFPAKEGGGSPSESPEPAGLASPPPTPTRLPTATAVPEPEVVETRRPACLEQNGQVQIEEIESQIFGHTLEYRVYLPPCYAADPQQHYPVLYLIHGMGATTEQWDRLGVDETADALIAAGEMQPFLIVLPTDRDARLRVENPFGEALVQELVPHIDSTYRTQSGREQRAIGGLSRGAGWAVKIGLTHWKQFGAVGAHSLALYWRDIREIPGWLDAIPAESLPHFYLDIGSKDPELQNTQEFESLLHARKVPYEWHLFPGYHDEVYWAAHLEQYLRWYAQQWALPYPPPADP